MSQRKETGFRILSARFRLRSGQIFMNNFKRTKFRRKLCESDFRELPWGKKTFAMYVLHSGDCCESRVPDLLSLKINFQEDNLPTNRNLRVHCHNIAKPNLQ